ncbi:MAG: MtnX-like HAD-IB family phosphatase [Clostridiales bacterium]|nr:MtnX-like HAD-IB family phosphatase [Eubacteriales bacterium]MDH7565682.1 MtnX-like HAD-IB family phosphatase [Clostridiales bacterium]
MKKVFFVDFDGTVTKTDTCSTMVQIFARDGWKELNRLWEERKLSTKDCAKALFKLFDASLEDIESFLNTVEMDGHFKEFLSLCRERGYRVYILSDGYDFNIRTIMQKYGIKDVEFYANKLLYHPGKGFDIECPYENPRCKNCGTCKKGLMEKLKGEDAQVIYVGDSYSDMCPAGAADLVFAKDVLYRYCMEKGIRAVHYSSFGDILSALAKPESTEEI